MSESDALAAAGTAPSSSPSAPELSSPAVDANASSSLSPSPTATSASADRIAYPSPTTSQDPAGQDKPRCRRLPYSSPNLTLEEKRKETRELGLVSRSADVARYMLLPENAPLVSNLDDKARRLGIDPSVLLRDAVLAYSDEIRRAPLQMMRDTKADGVRWIVEWLERPVAGGEGSRGQPRGIEQVLESGGIAS